MILKIVKNVNPKKPITLRNRTKYFDPNKDKVLVTFASPDSYDFRQSKIEGYENRLYWQFKYCQEVGGQTFFYTLTYNDEHIPHHYGLNCFDYEDLRLLLNGGFKKLLLRKFGTILKYFVGAELGDGAGERGLHNNPHYHILFFLEPDKGTPKRPPFQYIRIDSSTFRHYLREYWQGFDEALDGYHDYRSSKFGIVKEGEDLGLVSDFRACMYCAKYVCKDVYLKRNEVNVENSIRMSARNAYQDSEELYKAFFHSYIYSNFNIPLDAKNNTWTFTDGELVDHYFPESSFTANLLNDVKSYKSVVHSFCNRFNLWKEYQNFLNDAIESKVQEGLKEYRNRYCNKCRISHGVGDFALDNLTDKSNPTIKVPDKHGFKERPIGLYYYRKLFCDVVKDLKGSNLYVLNEKGIEYRSRKFPELLKKKMDSAYSDFCKLNSRELFDKMFNSDVNTDVSFSYDSFVRQVHKCYDSKIDFIERYAEYKLVYQNRYFPFDLDGCDIGCEFPVIDVEADYKRFLKPSFYSVSRSDLRLDSFLDSGCKGYLSYDSHPYFLPCLSIFLVLDLCSDYLFVKTDDKLQQEAEDISRIKRFHKCRELKDYYSSLVKS